MKRKKIKSKTKLSEMYSKYGAGALRDRANKSGHKYWTFCDQCDSETPALRDMSCLMCGSTSDRGLRRNAGFGIVNVKPNCDIITSTDWEDKENTLVYEKSLSPVCVGQKVRSKEGYIVSGGRAPHKASSSGRVYVRTIGKGDPRLRMGREFFPHVFNMKWIPSYNLYPMDKVSGKARLKINRNSSRNDLIEGAVDVIIKTRDFVGNEKQAIRDYCFENKISDCKGFYKIAMAKANLEWNAYRRDARGLRGNAESGKNRFFGAKLKRGIRRPKKGRMMFNNAENRFFGAKLKGGIRRPKKGRMMFNNAPDSNSIKKLIEDLALDFSPVVKDIESSPYPTTQNNYGRYMSLISSMSKGDKSRAEIIAMALITAGANRSGVKSALRVMFGE